MRQLSSRPRVRLRELRSVAQRAGLRDTGLRMLAWHKLLQLDVYNEHAVTCVVRMQDPPGGLSAGAGAAAGSGAAGATGDGSDDSGSSGDGGKGGVATAGHGHSKELDVLPYVLEGSRVRGKYSVQILVDVRRSMWQFDICATMQPGQRKKYTRQLFHMLDVLFQEHPSLHYYQARCTRARVL